MPYWKCHYHVIWATKHRQPTLLLAYESIIFSIVRDKTASMGGHVFAVNGTEDHIHVAASIPPSVAISEWVANVKGASAHAVNTSFQPESRFHWQGGYGVLTFGEKQLSWVVRYIEAQKDHHAANDLHQRLETWEE